MRDLDPDRKNGRASLYATVTADLVESRRLGNRADAQDKLGRLVRSLNARFKQAGGRGPWMPSALRLVLGGRGSTV